MDYIKWQVSTYKYKLIARLRSPNFIMLKFSDVSPVVKLPLSLARQIYDIIFSGSDEDEEDDDDDDGDGYLAIKLQCEEGKFH